MKNIFVFHFGIFIKFGLNLSKMSAKKYLLFKIIIKKNKKKFGTRICEIERLR